jgi:hypothetical protein
MLRIRSASQKSVYGVDFITSGILRFIRPPMEGQFSQPGQPIEIAAGGRQSDNWSGNPEARWEAVHVAMYPADHGLFFCGHILYRDKTEIVRRTSFCRRYDPDLGYWPPSTHYVLITPIEA